MSQPRISRTQERGRSRALGTGLRTSDGYAAGADVRGCGYGESFSLFEGGFRHSSRSQTRRAGPKQRKTPIGMAKMLQNLSIVPSECGGEAVKQSLFREEPRSETGVQFRFGVLSRWSSASSAGVSARPFFV